MTKNSIPVAVLIAGILIAGAVIYINQSGQPESENLAGPGQFLSIEEAGEKVIDFVNNNILRGQTTASLIEILEEDGLYII